MSARSLSPGAAILRKSKVFAIPAPLPWRPEPNIDGQVRSKTATAPCPTHLSLSTPLSSLSRGDWGLKRRLPLKTTTRTSSPSIRVQEIDTVEQITGFQSSADHAINLQKWHELNLPLTSPAVKQSDSSLSMIRRSVFDEDIDTLHQTNDSQVGREAITWKFKGPWLAGFNDGEFSEYFRTHVRGRRAEFRQLLREQYAKVKTHELRSALITSGVQQEELPTVEASDVSEEELAAYIKRLRHGKKELYMIIRKFLDLPPASVSEQLNSAHKVEQVFFNKDVSKAEPIDEFTHPYAEAGPPKTHPSAGLSYLRTASFTPHHPVYGPQANKPPVEARVLMPKSVSNSSVRTAMIGLAGFVSRIPTGFEPQQSSYTHGFKISRHSPKNLVVRIPGLINLEPDAPGGSKSWIHPTIAQIDSTGRVQLEWELGNPEAVAVRTNKVDEIQNDQKKQVFWRGVGAFPRPNLNNSSQRTNEGSSAARKQNRLSSASEYGLSTLVPLPKKPSYKEVLDKQETASELDSLLDHYA
ncbi:hypothetical protein K3495_g9524 [Podosphaera aphanis]|nr:hypothetical protein K3495_g9524 [Podosphaera aphanis]